jgi:hypothetical protein
MRPRESLETRPETSLPSRHGGGGIGREACEKGGPCMSTALPNIPLYISLKGTMQGSSRVRPLKDPYGDPCLHSFCLGLGVLQVPLRSLPVLPEAVVDGLRLSTPKTIKKKLKRANVLANAGFRYYEALNGPLGRI